ncbi:flagellar assembly protein FliW [Caldalkalibacillus salinus]|uniref:flagellar assembly protein FliW n=1 Tax=Caldalkalibacillus salinus TaxID=2803787 RepID=UPI0019240547|nr:flagellar assembly protein FliW [Caldalkalibacillus salinus]
MQLQTTRFGELQIEEDRILHFNKGLLGFEDKHGFVLIPAQEGETSFYYLQSVEEESLSFILLDTLTFFKDYDFTLKDQVLKELNIQKPEDIQVFTLVTVTDSLKHATTNLKAPVIIHTHNRQGKQIVLEEDYLIKQPLFQNASTSSPGQTTQTTSPRDATTGG